MRLTRVPCKLSRSRPRPVHRFARPWLGPPSRRARNPKGALLGRQGSRGGVYGPRIAPIWALWTLVQYRASPKGQSEPARCVSCGGVLTLRERPKILPLLREGGIGRVGGAGGDDENVG
jgi:hypothetical protein